MYPRTRTADSQAILLLCAPPGESLDPDERAVPLTAAEWTLLAQVLPRSDWNRPGLLLGRTVGMLRSHLDITEQFATRIADLLDRGSEVTAELDRLADRGIWVITWADSHYPPNFKQRLGFSAPALLFGSGDLELLTGDGLALLGTRDLDEDGARFVRELGTRAAESGLTICSPASRGTDRVAMLAAVQQFGNAVGVVAGNLQQAVRDLELAGPIRSGRLALMSPFHPATLPDVASAMTRNQLICCFSEFSVMVSCGIDGGSAWDSAIENLRWRWTPLFVRADAGVPEGNVELARMGGIPITLDVMPRGRQFRESLTRRAAGLPEEELLPAPEPATVESASAEAARPAAAETTVARRPRARAPRKTEAVARLGHAAQRAPQIVEAQPLPALSAPADAPGAVSAVVAASVAATTAAERIAASQPATVEGRRATRESKPASAATDEALASTMADQDEPVSMPAPEMPVTTSASTPPPDVIELPAPPANEPRRERARAKGAAAAAALVTEEDSPTTVLTEAPVTALAPRGTRPVRIRRAEPPAGGADEEPAAPLPSVDMYTLVWPYFQLLMTAPRSEREIATALNVQPAQARAWLERAVEEGRLEAAQGGSGRYRLPAPAPVVIAPARPRRGRAAG